MQAFTHSSQARHDVFKLQVSDKGYRRGRFQLRLLGQTNFRWSALCPEESKFTKKILTNNAAQ